jgi:two-component system cell cycle response regulator
MARILIVEDNAANLELMRYLLTSFGHEVVTRTRAADALEEARSGSFDVILSDILMPGMDGFSFAKSVRAMPRGAQVRLVAVTALAMVGDRERVLEAGFNGYIAKPIEPENFAGLVESFITAQEDAGEPLVLAVDDNRINLEVLEATLRPSGFRITTASNAREAIKKLEAERPKLILCDVHMDDGDGFAFIEFVKARDELASIPFIFISSTAWQTSDRRRGMELGAEKFIVRPIDPQRLIAEVESSLRGGDGPDPDR